MPTDTQEIIWGAMRDALEKHGEQLTNINEKLETLIRVEERQSSTDQRVTAQGVDIRSLRDDLKAAKKEIQTLKSSDDKKAVLWSWIERGVWVLLVIGATTFFQINKSEPEYPDRWQERGK